MAAFKRFLVKLAVWSFVLVVVVTTGWLLIALKYVYSTGERAGYVQKFSKKGWLIKTWEGDLAMVNLPGQISERFEFTVRDPKIAEQISRTMGRRVVIKYNQHRFLPGQLFGDTEYFVAEVREEPNENAPETPAEAAPSAGAPQGSI
jgi:hypothetical protein